MPPFVFILLLCPAVMVAAPFFLLGSQGDHGNPACRAAKNWLLIYGAIASGATVWLLAFHDGLDKTVLLPSSSLWSALVGGYLGGAWAGVSIWLLALGALTGRMRREIPGVMAPLQLQLGVWVLGAMAEETWRIATIMAILSSESSIARSYAVLLTALAFGLAHLGSGSQRAAVATLEGVFFGFLFLWRGSILAVFTAHLVLQAVYLWGVGQIFLNRSSRATWQIPGTKCPVCRAPLKLLQIKLSEVFDCPACKERLSLTDSYQNIMRFCGAASFSVLLVFTLLLLKDWVPNAVLPWLSYLVSYGAATSGLLLYRKTFVRLFPPRLQAGTPHFITLNLETRQRPKASDFESRDDRRTGEM